MRILITGGCGFIGSNFIHHMLKNTDHEIINLDILTYSGNPSNLRDVEDNENTDLSGAGLKIKACYGAYQRFRPYR